MNKFAFILLFLSLLCEVLVAQSLSTPADLDQIIAKSKIKYLVAEKYKPVDNKEYPLIQRVSNTAFETEKENLEKNFKRAQKAIERKDFSKAEVYLTRASSVDITNQVIKQSLAGVYVENEKYEMALKLYRQILAQNPFDYELHQQIALCYQKVNRTQEAIHHITVAHIYNRNHAEIIATMKSIYLENGYIFQNWSLEPKYSISANEDSTTIHIAYKEEPWGAYAKCKAIWDFEEDYNNKMHYLSDQALHIVEEKECLLNAIISYELVDNKEHYPELAALGKSLKMKLVDEYIFYEKILRENPELILNFEQEEVNRLLNYIKKMHVISLVQ